MGICVACDRECPPGLRWCSNACFEAEDGPHYEDDLLDDEVDPRDEADWD